jgi:hypothetical protein
MITNLIIIVLPRVEVQVLQQSLALLGSVGGDEHVVQLLGVHVEEVRVSLFWCNVRDVVELEHGADGHEFLEGSDLCEFVEVAGGDDAGLGVDREDLGDEVLDFVRLTYTQFRLRPALYLQQ